MVKLLRSVNETARQVAIVIYTTVTEERPPATHLFRALHVDIHYGHGLLVVRCKINHLALRSGNELEPQNVIPLVAPEGSGS